MWYAYAIEWSVLFELLRRLRNCARSDQIAKGNDDDDGSNNARQGCCGAYVCVCARVRVNRIIIVCVRLWGAWTNLN